MVDVLLLQHCDAVKDLANLSVSSCQSSQMQQGQEFGKVELHQANKSMAPTSDMMPPSGNKSNQPKIPPNNNNNNKNNNNNNNNNNSNRNQNNHSNKNNNNNTSDCHRKELRNNCATMLNANILLFKKKKQAKFLRTTLVTLILLLGKSIRTTPAAKSCRSGDKTVVGSERMVLASLVLSKRIHCEHHLIKHHGRREPR